MWRRLSTHERQYRSEDGDHGHDCDQGRPCKPTDLLRDEEMVNGTGNSRKTTNSPQLSLSDTRKLLRIEGFPRVELDQADAL